MFIITANKRTQTVRTPRRANMAVEFAYERKGDKRHIAMYKKWIDEHYKTQKRALYAVGDTANGIIVEIEYIPDERMETA